ncbi:MAG: hypothetical protein QOJ72_839 [Nocardioidaceae bacterium]|nr:hypothetical protein [Nocardioidaceae bacterium]
MDKNRLAPFVSGAIAIAGLLAEAIGPVGSVLLGTADYAAGATLLFLAEPHAFAASAAWFAGTAVGGVSAPTYVAMVLTLAYRPPLLLLGARHLGLHSRWLWSLWLIALLPVRGAGWISLVLATLLAAKALGGRQLLLGLAFGATAATWSFGAMGQKNTDLLTLTTDASVMLIAVACLIESGRAAAAHRIREVVIDIGPSAEPTPALIDQLRRRLADPELRVLFRTAGLEWVDESGQPGTLPPGAHVTYSATTDGVQAALVHSRTPISTEEAEVALAAATAASIAMASARLDLEVRARAAAVAASRARLLSVAEEERRALEQRLRRGPLARIGKIELLLESLADEEAPSLKRELAAAQEDLRRLARGLYPASVDGSTVLQMLESLRAASPLSTDIEVGGMSVEPSGSARALVHFLVSEAMANALRHAHARHLRITVTSDSELTVTIRDDGVGGAVMSSRGGLRGLSDRLEAAGGRLSVISPAGGPSTVTGTLPVDF